MPFKTKILILGSVTVFLSLTLLGGLLVQNIQRTGDSGGTILATGLSARTITSFSLVRPSSPEISITMIDSKWWIKEGDDKWPVRTSRVEDFLGSISTLNRLRTVTESPKAYAELKIEDSLASALTMSDTGGKSQQTLFFGDVSLDGSEQYLRDKTNPKVWAIKSGTAFWLQQDNKYWLDKRIWPDSMTTSAIVACQFSSPKTGMLNLTKQSKNGVDTWTVEGASASSVKKDQLASWTQNLFGLEGDEAIVFNDLTTNGSFIEAFRVGIRDQSGTNRETLIYKPTAEGEAWLAVPQYADSPKTINGQKLAFKLPEWKLQRGVMGD